MKKILVLCLFLVGLFLIAGCENQGIYSDKFKVKYYAKYSSSGGDRILDIIYTVEKGEIISCEGNYTTDMTDKTTTYDCDIERLKIKDYNVPLNFITEISSDQELTGEVQEGPSLYKWEIILSP